MSWIDWCIVFIPLLIVLYLGLKSQRYVHGVAGFLAADRVAGRYVVASPYRKPLSFEIIMKATPFQKTPFSPLPNSSEEDQRAYLKDAYAKCERVCRMYETVKQAL